MSKGNRGRPPTVIPLFQVAGLLDGADNRSLAVFQCLID